MQKDTSNVTTPSNLNKLLLSGFSGQDNTLTVPKLYVQLLGDHKKAFVLNQIIFWSNKSKVGKDGWFYKTYDDWFDELLIPERTLRRVFNSLETKGICETKVKKLGGSTVLWVRPLVDNILNALNELVLGTATLAEPDRPLCPDSCSATLADPSYIQMSTTEDNLQNIKNNNKKEKVIHKTDGTGLAVQDIQNLNPHHIPPQMIRDWLEVRSAKKKPVTATAWRRLTSQLGKCKDPIEAFEIMVTQGWVGFNSAWIDNLSGSADKTKKKKRTDMDKAYESTDWVNKV